MLFMLIKSMVRYLSVDCRNDKILKTGELYAAGNQE